VLGNIVLAFTVIGIASQIPGCRSSLECTAFHSERIAAGRSYSHPLQRALVFRFTAETGRGLEQAEPVWHITVGPEGPGDRIDYVWPVSPPINSTRHLFVGAGLDWTAAHSLRMNPRRLRFVLTAQELRQAESAYQRIVKQAVSNQPFDSTPLRDLGRGELTVTFGNVVVTDDRIESLTLFVRSCVPE
jgi:hypothetical protein